MLAAATVAGLLVAPEAASAGVYADDLAKCMVRSISDADRGDVVLWIFSSISEHPSVSPYSAMTEAQKTDFNKRAAVLIERLLTQTCRKEALEALRYEGESAIEPAFNVLGQTAMRSLMSDPKVQAGTERFSTYLDENKFQALFKDAGLAPPDAKAK